MYKKLMVISKNPDLLSPLEKELESRSIEVAKASNGADAFRMILEDICDLLIVDIIPPKLDSLIICKMLKLRPSLRNIPIIVITSEIGENIEIVSNRSGASELIKKPDDPMEVMPVILKYLGRDN